MDIPYIPIGDTCAVAYNLKQLNIRTVYHTLVHKTNGTTLPDSYIKYINLSSTYLSNLDNLGFGQSKASRQIIGVGKTSTLTLAPNGLLFFVGRNSASIYGYVDVSAQTVTSLTPTGGWSANNFLISSSSIFLKESSVQSALSSYISVLA